MSSFIITTIIFNISYNYSDSIPVRYSDKREENSIFSTSEHNFSSPGFNSRGLPMSRSDSQGEPNNNLSNAKFIKLKLSGNSFLFGNFTPTDSIDWYKFNVTKGDNNGNNADRFYFSLTDDNTTTGVLMELFTPSPWPHKLVRSIVHDKDSGSPDPAMIDMVAPLDGTYYLKIIPNGLPTKANESYVLSYGRLKEATNAAYDNDNSFDSPFVKWVDPNAESVIISDYLSAVWDVHDHYNFTGYENQTLEIILSPPSTGDFDLYLYDNKSSKFINSSEKWGKGSGAQEYIKYKLPEDKEYYIRIVAKINDTKPVENEDNRGKYNLMFKSNVPPRWRKSSEEHYYMNEDSKPVSFDPGDLWIDLNNDKLDYLLWNYTSMTWEPRDDEQKVISSVNYKAFKIQIINKNIPTNPDIIIKITPFANKHGTTKVKIGAKDKPDGAYGEHNITVHIKPVNDPPILNNTLSWEDMLGTAFFGNNQVSIFELNHAKIKIDAFDVDNDNLTYIIDFEDDSSAFAKNFHIDSKTGIISFYADYRYIGLYNVNISVKDDGKSPDNLIDAKRVTFIITTYNVNRIPKTYLKSPLNGSTIRSSIPTFIWNVTDADTSFENISFSVYLSNDLIKILTLSNDVLLSVVSNNSQYTVSNPLVDKMTYYWTVVPNDGIFTGVCEDDYSYFYIDTSVEAPEVYLISPIHMTILNYTEVELQWDISYDGDDIVFYDVYIGNTPWNLNMEATVDVSRYKTEYLLFGRTYYWQVVPKVGIGLETIEGDKSQIWSFSIKKNHIPPIVYLESPIDKSILKTNNLSLTWSIDYKDHEKVEYRLQVANSTNFNNLSYVSIKSKTFHYLNNLVEGKYYWRVVPYINEVPGVVSDYWSFTIITQVDQPLVVLRSPLDNSTLNSTWIELKWKLEYTGPISLVSYDIYLDNRTNDTTFMTMVKKDYRQLFISFELNDYDTYYWRVVPKVRSDEGIIIGRFNKNVAKFSINSTYRPTPNPKFNFTLTPTVMKLSPGDSKNVKLHFNNNGNIDLLIQIKFESEPVDILIIKPETSIITLPVGGDDFIEFNIETPGDIEKKVCVITFECTLKDFGVSKKDVLTVEITEKESKEQDGIDIGSSIGILLVIVVIVILILLFLFKVIKRKKSISTTEKVEISDSDIDSEARVAAPDSADTIKTDDLEDGEEPSKKELEPEHEPTVEHITTEIAKPVSKSEGASVGLAKPAAAVAVPVMAAPAISEEESIAKAKPAKAKPTKAKHTKAKPAKAKIAKPAEPVKEDKVEKEDLDEIGLDKSNNEKSANENSEVNKKEKKSSDNKKNRDSKK